jgi:hypothetical protein
MSPQQGSILEILSCKVNIWISVSGTLIWEGCGGKVRRICDVEEDVVLTSERLTPAQPTKTLQQIDKRKQIDSGDKRKLKIGMVITSRWNMNKSQTVNYSLQRRRAGPLWIIGFIVIWRGTVWFYNNCKVDFSNFYFAQSLKIVTYVKKCNFSIIDAIPNSWNKSKLQSWHS